MHFDLTPELKEFQRAARHFVDSELVPHELTVDEHEARPWAVLRASLSGIEPDGDVETACET